MIIELNYNSREAFYNKHLQEIAGTKFTIREADIIACILTNGGEKKIADLLSISHRTVSSHVRNIMNKMGCNARDQIIDIIEKSGKLTYLRQYYSLLALQVKFEKELQKIKVTVNHLGIICSADFDQASNEEQAILKKIEADLKSANISLISGKKKPKNITKHLCILGDSESSKASDHISLLLSKNSKPTQNVQSQYVDFSDDNNYYLALLELIWNITGEPVIVKTINEFKNTKDSLENEDVESLQMEDKQPNKLKIAVVLLCFLLIFGLLIKFVNAQKTQSASGAATQIGVETEWNLPANLEHFSERKDITQALWRKFKTGADKKKTVVLAGLHGLGGIGKTTLAKAALHDPQQTYSFKGWFSAETKELLQADYINLGDKQNLFAGNLSIEQKIALVKNWLGQQPHALLVYDNAPDMLLLQEFMPEKGHIIITSRNRNIPGAIEIDVMSEAEAVKLLDNLMSENLKSLKNYQRDLKVLAQKLGYLPLALSQAGAYISENKINIEQYLILYSTERDQLLSDATMPSMDEHQSAYVTWDMSIKQLRKQPGGERAIAALELIACCYPENIPNKLLAQYLYGAADNEAIFKLHHTLALLRQYSLIKTAENAISTHRLVHAWSGSKLSEEEKIATLKKAAIAIKKSYPYNSKTNADTVFIKLLLPSAEAILVQMRKTTNALDYIDLLSVLGDIHCTLGNTRQSKIFFEEALNANEKYFGKDSIEAAKALHQIGKIHLYLGDHAKAKEMLGKSLKTKGEYFGFEHIETSNSMQQLGKINLYMGNYTESRELLEKSFVIKKEYFGDEHIQAMKALYNTGKVYIYLGYPLKSKDILEKSLLHIEKHLGPDHLDVSYVLYQLGKVYLYLGKYDKSEKALARSLLIMKKHLHPEHVIIAYAEHQVGRLHFSLGNYTKAKEYLENALEIKKKYFGLEHVETSYTLQHLGRTYLCLGKYRKAQELLETALRIKIDYFGQENMHTAYIKGIVGWMYINLNDYDKAKKLLVSSHDIVTKLYGSQNIFTLKASVSLSNLYRLLKDYEKSKELLESSLDLMEKLHSYDPITIAMTKANLGLLYGQMGDTDKKQQYLQSALTVFKEKLPASHPYIKQAQDSLTSTDDSTNIGYPIILLP